ncbi:MAG: Fe2+ transporter FeoB [Thermodesulfobacterium sp.]|uniref:Ferrous iron transport protein B n=1 Tax=Candidatus Thermodesulfobacterium syntrophicum TaxID=3060442 RepID=A0AAE3P4V9_9BACT|nr:Fe2+ transporter FeoB [Candidatus Thermodesulfobacterium syntrophicum]
MEKDFKEIKVVLVGNPNVGKTSILNHLVKGNLKIGNWSGVTVERKEGQAFFKDYKITFIDLPGVYTIEEIISEDEKIALDFLLNGDYDIILNIVETPKIERDAYLTCQLLDMEKPLIVVLNMIDEAEEFGVEVSAERLSELLKIIVIKTNGRTGEGVEEIFPAIIEVYEKNMKPVSIVYPSEIEERIKKIEGIKWVKLQKLIKENPELYESIKEKRLKFSRGLTKEVTRRRILNKRTLTEILDNIFLHPILGILCFFLIMYLFFKISFDFSTPFVDWIDNFMQDFLAPLTFSFLNKLGTPQFLISFFTGAVIGGVGIVLTFFPLIMVMYFLLTLLETSGYLPRVAFLMDRFTHKIGLHGQSIIPLILGLGCNVPAVVATRTFQDTKDKLLVIAMIPFISCPARLVVSSFIALTFFKNPTLIIFILYLLGFIFSILTSLILRKTLLKKELSHFVMDLPPYRVPSLKMVYNITIGYLKSFLYKAGTVIFTVSVVIWLFLNLPYGEKNIEDTLAGKIGKSLSYIFEPVGLGDWRITTSLLSGFLAREAIISNMGIIVTQEEKEEVYPEIKIGLALKEQVINLGKAIKESFASFFYFLPKTLEVGEELSGLKDKIKGLLTPKQAISFLLFVLIYNSCLATVVVMAKEGNWKFSLGFLLYSFVLAWLIAFVNFNIF